MRIEIIFCKFRTDIRIRNRYYDAPYVEVYGDSVYIHVNGPEFPAKYLSLCRDLKFKAPSMEYPTVFIWNRRE